MNGEEQDQQVSRLRGSIMGQSTCLHMLGPTRYFTFLISFSNCLDMFKCFSCNKL